MTIVDLVSKDCYEEYRSDIRRIVNDLLPSFIDSLRDNFYDCTSQKFVIVKDVNSICNNASTLRHIVLPEIAVNKFDSKYSGLLYLLCVNVIDHIIRTINNIYIDLTCISYIVDGKYHSDYENWKDYLDVLFGITDVPNDAITNYAPDLYVAEHVMLRFLDNEYVKRFSHCSISFILRDENFCELYKLILKICDKLDINSLHNDPCDEPDYDLEDRFTHKVSSILEYHSIEHNLIEFDEQSDSSSEYYYDPFD